MNNPTSLKGFLLKVIEKITDFLLPKEEKVKLLEGLAPTDLFERIPRAEDFDLPVGEAGFETDKVKAVFSYKNNLCRQAIWEIKYRANYTLIRNFSLLLYDFILDELSDLNTFENFKNILLIPTPSSKAREREKGFNQCVLICRELVNIDQERNKNSNYLFTLVDDLLVKKVNTDRQSKTKNRKQRLENLKDTFMVNPFSTTPTSEGHPSLNKEGKADIQNYSFIIIDDVITTGATMNEAFRALKVAGAKKIRGFSLAH